MGKKSYIRGGVCLYFFIFGRNRIKSGVLEGACPFRFGYNEQIVNNLT